MEIYPDIEFQMREFIELHFVTLAQRLVTLTGLLMSKIKIGKDNIQDRTPRQEHEFISLKAYVGYMVRPSHVQIIREICIS